MTAVMVRLNDCNCYEVLDVTELGLESSRAYHLASQLLREAWTDWLRENGSHGGDKFLRLLPDEATSGPC